jgi:hypothetical protein
MQCYKCGNLIEKGEEREMHGQVLCEDCYMDALSPARACDPWAVYTAKSLAKDEDDLTSTQKRILDVLHETGGTEPAILAERLQISPSDLEREIAALRHMEKVRGELRHGKKVLRLW